MTMETAKALMLIVDGCVILWQACVIRKLRRENKEIREQARAIRLSHLLPGRGRPGGGSVLRGFYKW